ncbi:hypothetical protein Hanom_Chr09g00857271 [Helianthus anomalus]
MSDLKHSAHTHTEQSPIHTPITDRTPQSPPSLSLGYPLPAPNSTTAGESLESEDEVSH